MKPVALKRENTQYCNNWANDCIDVKGADIYHVVDISTCGHSAVIIGNPQDGYYALNFGGGGGGYTGIALTESQRANQTIVNQCEKELQNHHHATLQKAFEDLDDGRTGCNAYDYIQKWEASPGQDQAAITAAKEVLTHEYNSCFNNCVSVVEKALDAANVYYSHNPYPYSTNNQNPYSISNQNPLDMDILAGFQFLPLVFYLENIPYSENFDRDSFLHNSME